MKRIPAICTRCKKCLSKLFKQSKHKSLGQFTKRLVCRHLRPGPRDKQQSLVVALLRAKQERLLSSRKRWVVDTIVTIHSTL